MAEPYSRSSRKTSDTEGDTEGGACTTRAVSLTGHRLSLGGLLAVRKGHAWVHMHRVGMGCPNEGFLVASCSATQERMVHDQHREP